MKISELLTESHDYDDEDELSSNLNWFGSTGRNEIQAPNTEGAKKLDRKDLPQNQSFEWGEDGDELTAMLFFEYFQLKNGKFVIHVSGNDGYQTFDNEGHVVKVLDKAAVDKIVKAFKKDMNSD